MHLQQYGSELGLELNQAEGILIPAWIIHLYTRKPEYRKALEILDARIITAHGLCFDDIIERQKAENEYKCVMANRFAEYDFIFKKSREGNSPFLLGKTILKNTLNNGIPDERLDYASMTFKIGVCTISMMIAVPRLLDSYSLRDS